MAMLEITPVPLHRSQYPGELHLWIGGQSERGATMWVPGNWGVTVQYYNEEQPGLVKVRFDTSEGFATRNVRFTDPAMFNDLMVSLAVKAGAPLERATRTRVLETLLGDVNKNTAAQMDWYVTHGATSDDAYMAEIEEFSDLIAAYRAAIAAQMAG